MADTNFTDDSTVTAAAWFDDANTVTYSSLTSVSGTDTITATGPSTLSAYATGQRFVFVPAATNTGGTTINITPSGGAALGAKNVFCKGVACRGGEIRSGVSCLISYDGTQFNIIGPDYNTIAIQTETGATATIASGNTAMIANRAGTITVTLPSASANPGRWLMIKTIQAQTVVSASSNVAPIGDLSASTAILPATDGAWAFLVSDATNWVVMMTG